MPLHNKVILVTGSAKRIGRAIALALAHEGARVAIHYGSSETEARRTAEECGGAPIFKANLESVTEIRAMFINVANHFGRLDGLVNNAARFTRFDPLDIEESDWDFIHSTNLKAVFFCCQAAARIMLAGDGGHIVNISSLGALKPWAHHAHYGASKAGVVMLTKSLAKAWAPKIAVNSVAPGVIPFDKTDERIEKLIQATPACRAGTGADIAEAVLLFVNATTFITGQTIAVDGGPEPAMSGISSRLVGRGFCPAAELPLGVCGGNENPRIIRKGRSPSPRHAGQKPGSRAEALPHDAVREN